MYINSGTWFLPLLQQNRPWCIHLALFLGTLQPPSCFSPCFPCGCVVPLPVWVGILITKMEMKTHSMFEITQSKLAVLSVTVVSSRVTWSGLQRVCCRGKPKKIGNHNYQPARIQPWIQYGIEVYPLLWQRPMVRPQAPTAGAVYSLLVWTLAHATWCACIFYNCRGSRPMKCCERFCSAKRTNENPLAWHTRHSIPWPPASSKLLAPDYSSNHDSELNTNKSSQSAKRNFRARVVSPKTLVWGDKQPGQTTGPQWRQQWLCCCCWAWQRYFPSFPSRDPLSIYTEKKGTRRCNSSHAKPTTTMGIPGIRLHRKDPAIVCMIFFPPNQIQISNVSFTCKHGREKKILARYTWLAHKADDARVVMF